MKCTECGNAMTKSVGDHVYRESGMDHVILRSVAKYACESCGAKRITIPQPAQLHRLLAELIAHKPARLVPSEVRFIRDHLELSNKDFAVMMGVTETQASRWTTSDPIGVPAEHLLRMFATLGSVTLAAEERPTFEIGKVAEHTTVAFPSRGESARELPMRIRRTTSEWKAEAPA